MTPQELETRKARAEKETFVISRTEEGYRIHLATAPQKVYVVGKDLTKPTCSCPDFEYHEKDPDWRCKHVLAVLDLQKKGGETPETVEAEERKAIREAGEPTPRPAPVEGGQEAPRLCLKRSVSPDGRIDSLSVEVSFPVDGTSAAAIKERAVRALQLQSEIAGSFLASDRRLIPPAREPENGSGASVLAELQDVRSMHTKWGRKLIINVQANGRRLRLIGSLERLGKHLAAAGYPEQARTLKEGMVLNLPCRVVTKPSQDGKYLVIDQVLPAGPRPQEARQPR